MMILSMLIGAIASGSCFEVVDDQDIAQATEVFIGAPVSSEGGQIEVTVLRPYRMSDPDLGPGDEYRLPGVLRDEIGWREISATIDHRDPGYLDSDIFYIGLVFDDFSDGCEVRYNLADGVPYMFILGTQAKLRSVEPISSVTLDPWVQYVERSLATRTEPR
tara:strand:+ start:3523 stop:4008 length:486 start_codon:yes stop_codon:yes gene_type:complete